MHWGNPQGWPEQTPGKCQGPVKPFGWDEKPSEVHLWSTSWHRSLSWGSVFRLVQHLEGGTAFLNVLARSETWQHTHVGPAWDSVRLHSILSWIQKGLNMSLALDGSSSRLSLVSIHTADISLVRNRTWFRPNVSPPWGACFMWV